MKELVHIAVIGVTIGAGLQAGEELVKVGIKKIKDHHGINQKWKKVKDKVAAIKAGKKVLEEEASKKGI